MKLIGKSPFRISFYGGGTDIEPYPSQFGSCCISHSINLGCYGSIDFNVKNKIIENLNIKKKFFYNKDFLNNKIFKVFDFYSQQLNYHFKYHFDLPTGSGLGSSGAFMALISKFLMVLKKNSNKKDIANLAYHLEKNILKTSGGRQDEFSSVYGGFNFIEFKNNNSFVKKIVPTKRFMFEIQSRSLLMFTGIIRDGGQVIDKHIKIYQDKDKIKLLHQNKNLALKAKNFIERNDFKNFIDNINLYWKLKKKYNPAVTNSKIDKLISVVLESGAHSAKLLGAGNGGHLLIFTPVEKRQIVIERLEKLGCFQRYFSYIDNSCEVFNQKIFL
jgi:D-glycero-alpha-D-manno-heptose-7-phosphate kinase